MADTPDEVSPDLTTREGKAAASHEETIKARTIELVFGASSLWAHLVFLTVLAAGTVLLLVELFNYAERARQFPLITFVVSLLLIAFRTAQVILVARRDGQPDPNKAQLIRALMMVGWVILLGTSTLLFGVIPGAMVFLVAYLAVHRPAGIIGSVAVVIAVWLTSHVIFVEVLNLPFRPGVLFR